ncbi:MAG: isopeptide-forming domain-containing fimbrial protein [Clostridia bacterium]|nr:isopeptide-forming domain-containing fimbrial protein [Clostridia bacterium]
MSLADYVTLHYTARAEEIEGYTSVVEFNPYTIKVTYTYVGTTPTQPEEPTSGLTLTMKNADSDKHVFKAYAIFNGDVSETGGKLSNVVWGNGVRNVEGLLTALKDEELIPDSVATAADFAEELGTMNDDASRLIRIAAIITNGYLNTESGTSGDAVEGEAEGMYDYTISGLAPGYYLVTDSLTDDEDGFISRSILCLTSNTESEVKSDRITAEKKVKENTKYASDGGFGFGYNDVADASIGDPIEFEYIAAVPELALMQGYGRDFLFVFHDIFPASMTLDKNSFEGYVYDSAMETQKAEFTCGPVDDNGGFKVEVVLYDYAKDIFLCDGLAKGDKIVIRYKAALNGDAVIGGGGNVNSLILEYTDGPTPTSTSRTQQDDTVVFTYQVEFLKADGKTIDKEGVALKPLPGAKFTLSRTKDSVTEYYTEDTPYWTTDAESATVLVSGADGLFSVSGLDNGVYQLTETEAPDGYNRASQPWTVTISAETANGQATAPADGLRTVLVKVNEAEAEPLKENRGGSATIANYSGTVLPSTGGMGTVPFYILGGCLTVFAAAFIIYRKNRYAE